MMIHPKKKLIKEAENELREVLYNIQFNRELTEGEFFRVLGVAFREVDMWAKFKIREERHGDSNEPGGLA